MGPLRLSGAGRPARGPLLASLILLAGVVVFCAATRWGRMYPKMVVSSWRVWSHGHRLAAADRRLRFYDETYPILLQLKDSIPPQSVVILPPRGFVKAQVATRRPPGEDLVPLLGCASSAYGVIYPRIPVPFDDDSPWKKDATHLLAWDWWGLDLIDATIPRTEENRVRLFEAPGDAGVAPPPLPRIWRLPADDHSGPDRWITPGLLLGLLVLWALGDGTYRLLGRVRLRPPAPASAEGLAWRMLLAPAIVPWIVVLYDLAGVPFTRVSMVVAAAALLAAGLAVTPPARWAARRRSGSVARAAPSRPVENPDAAVSVDRSSESALPAPAAAVRASGSGSILGSPAALVLGLAAGSIVLLGLVQLAILPERNYDALVGYDLVGKILAAEGRLRSSIFDRIVYNPQAVYPPFTSANNGYGYLFHEAVPHLWVSWLVGAFLLAFALWVRRRTGSGTLAALAAFLVLLPQALLTQGTTEARPDLPSMVYTVFAALAIIDLRGRRGGYGPPAMLLLVAATARTENVVFGVALAIACLLVRPVPPARGRAAWMVAAPLAFFLFWNLFFVKSLIGYDPAAHFRPLDFAPERIAEIVGRAFSIIAWPQVFGEFIVVVVAAPVGWLGWRFARRRGPSFVSAATRRARGAADPAEDLPGMLLLLAGLMFVCYLPFFYTWDPELNPLWSMRDTFKRGFFRFIPLLLVALLALPPVAEWLHRCDGRASADTPRPQ